ncbi:hypothetical protein [Haloechinothrix halophila]|uniref:hypothetical protein n=1 Tax=Haloechinothrix halophila TaxID=1069073 RepID=UPI00055359DD|nr:hypothetical protein [Haloechinothrix halophila]
MRSKTLVISAVLTCFVVLYLVLLAGRGVELLRTGETIPVVLGVGVLLLPLLGVWVLVSTWRSGLRVQRLAARLAEEGGLPDTSELPRRPSGRVDRDAADAWFADRKAELDADPDDWRGWYRIAQAYDLAGDRRRARDAMRTAVTLEEREPR